MDKLKLAGAFNSKDENYFNIKIDDINNESYIKKLIGLLKELKISNHFEAEPEILSSKYSDWIGRHEFFRTKDYIIHIIFSKDNMYLIVKCDPGKREVFMKSFNKIYSF
jgi:hypothetical protein